MITPQTLGSAAFRSDYGLRLAYVTGAMVKGIASADLVIQVGKAGALGFFGAGGVRRPAVEAAILRIREGLADGQAFGVNLLANPARPGEEMEMVDLLLRHGVRNAEASAYTRITPALLKFRLTGARKDGQGGAAAVNRVIAKISRPEIAQLFLRPAPEAMVTRLVEQGHLTPDEAALAQHLPVASDLCVESDSGGHTDMGVMSVLLPAMIRLRDDAQEQFRYARPVRVGAAGGIGTPEAAACAFLLGADFIVTGSINQCTREAGTSDAVKDILQGLGVQDTAYAPAGDMFEMGSKIQVMKKGVFFPTRANKLYDLWRTHGALDRIDGATRREIQEKYFRRGFDEVYREIRDHYLRAAPEEIERAERNPKVKMALIFRWYFVHSMRLALAGDRDQRVDYQVHTGPALGAFNQWVKGSPLEDWRHRRVAVVAEHLMEACADCLNRQVRLFAPTGAGTLAER
ncbi:PfaD family polyunsaturated fatty acid/polyketide biosynthesis protein [Azospirillum brasilense]|uniref:PfaD family polyunsaturated fatty acid/polyketide biosynthesis protein n=1 Tax=Azospirillum brasilense TaxID=192 RepID=UPI000E0CA068|nr:PfaD family polyunsaturated fatty acid/polyketide biosynthesis protein [Azospirillum brasilense]